jgi:alkylation response protein AidB-like acyl-CoA dehydrogenase
VQVHGGNGFTDRYPVERLFREAKVLEIIEGSSQIQQQTLAKYGLRAYFRDSA